MKKFVIALSALSLVSAAPEPPAASGYLPPSGNGGHGEYSNGITGAIVSGYGDHDGNGFAGRPSDAYGPPSLNDQGRLHDSYDAHGFGGIGNGDSGIAERGTYGDRRPFTSTGGHRVNSGHLSGSYGAPSGRGNDGGVPSSSYGSPGFHGFGGNGHASHDFGAANGHGSNHGRVPSSYGAPNGNRHISSAYGAPDGRGNHAGIPYEAPGGNGFPVNGHTSGAPQGKGFRTVSGFRPSSAYGGPNGHESSGGRPSSTYGEPNGIGFGGNGHLSDTYGAPGGANGGRPSPFNGSPHTGNGGSLAAGYHTASGVHPGGFGGYSEVPGGHNGVAGGYGGQAGNGYGISAPASYRYHYEVNDGEGTEFGHRESREGDEAQGEFRVLLPDGRRQIVSYTANQHGYQPEIRYEDNGVGGYGSGGSTHEGY